VNVGLACIAVSIDVDIFTGHIAVSIFCNAVVNVSFVKTFTHVRLVPV
jgi:hypothetical protein